MNIFKILIYLVSLAALSAWPVFFGSGMMMGCNETTGGSGGSGGGGGGGASQPTLTNADFPSVSPCSDRDTLPSDATLLDTITNAASVLHIHRRYDGDSTLPALCGLEGSWDPDAVSDAAGTEQRSTNTFEAAVSSFIQSRLLSGSSMTEVCRTGFQFADTPIDTDPGFLAAGTYRGEGCIESGGNSYRFRVRITVSGTDADKKFSEAGVTDESGLAIFDTSGTEIATAGQARSLVTGSPESLTFTVRSNSGATTHLTVVVEIICVKKLTTSCPAAS